MYVVNLNEHAFILEVYQSGKGRVGWRNGEMRNGLNRLCTVTHSWFISILTYSKRTSEFSDRNTWPRTGMITPRLRNSDVIPYSLC